MRTSDVDILLLPDWLTNTASEVSPEQQQWRSSHWISRWQSNLKTARWVSLSSTPQSHPTTRTSCLADQTRQSPRPHIMITHGRAVETLIEAGDVLASSSVVGALVVAPVLAASGQTPPVASPLAFPSVIVAPTNNPDMSTSAAERLTSDLGGEFVSAGPVERLDTDSGHGPWPEGLMRLGWFLKRLS